MDSLVEVVNGFIKQLAAQPSLKTVNVALRLGVLRIVLRALGRFYCRIATFLDLRRVLLALLKQLNHL